MHEKKLSMFAALVRQLMQIQNRRSQHRNFLVESVNGQNHYLIPAHSRSQVQLTLNNTVQSVHVSFASQSLAKSVSQTNLPARKATVLRQHKENLRLIRRLAMTKSHVEGGLQTASAAPVDLNSSFLQPTECSQSRRVDFKRIVTPVSECKTVPKKRQKVKSPVFGSPS